MSIVTAHPARSPNQKTESQIRMELHLRIKCQQLRVLLAGGRVGNTRQEDVGSREEIRALLHRLKRMLWRIARYPREE